jgi:ATP-binding cassette subfamily B protein
MLGTVMDHPPEREPGQRYIYPKINGEIEFEEVSFRYSPQANPALDRVSFRIEPGQMIGIVGRSGSGKSTITRLIQGIHNPDSGLLKVSGADIRHIDLNHLRRSIGIVLQDNFLFKGTIRENISATKTEASMDEIIEASRMAGAAEFIDRLPNSYGTVVQENASNFSGGQRQRIAIARALLPRPLLMIFDEATSALDPESEAIVQENLDKIAEGRTMIVVSHRLSSLVKADAILVLEQGSVVDFAPHNVLVERCEIYRHLWETQTRHIS